MHYVEADIQYIPAHGPWRQCPEEDKKTVICGIVNQKRDWWT